MRPVHLPLFFFAAVAADLAVAQNTSSCGDRIVVETGDTLSRITDRCQVSEGSLIRLNPEVDGSSDLRVGMQLRTRGEPASGGGDALGHLGAAAGNAADALTGLARDAKSSVEGFLAENPEVRQRIGRLGQKLSGETTGSTGTISVTPSEVTVGGTLSVTASGLPGDTQVVLGAGRPQAAYEVLERARTAADGTLRASVRIPEWAADAKRVVVVVAGEQGGWKVRSEPVAVSATKR
jgi:LysM repeat protein